MYCVSIQLLAKSGQSQKVIELFRQYIPLVTTLPGCIRFELNQSATDAHAFLLYELYESREALVAHRNDALFEVWRPRIAALEQSRQMQEFECLLSGSNGRIEG
jgi:quinol monooxygenase YgiN